MHVFQEFIMNSCVANKSIYCFITVIYLSRSFKFNEGTAIRNSDFEFNITGLNNRIESYLSQQFLLSGFGKTHLAPRIVKKIDGVHLPWRFLIETFGGRIGLLAGDFSPSMVIFCRCTREEKIRFICIKCTL